MKKNYMFSAGRRAASLMAAVLAALGGLAVQAQTLTVLSGPEGAGNGHESYHMLVDGDVTTKWYYVYGEQMNAPWLVLKADEAFVPGDYYLTTGNDSKDYSERNWYSWKIYAGNFESDEAATRDAEGWVLIDDKQEYLLPSANWATTRLSPSAPATEAYRYIRLEIEEINSPRPVGMQMAEFGYTEPARPNVIEYTNIWFNAGNGDSEGGDKLTDGNTGTKWGYNLGSTPAVTMFRASQAFVPYYYTLITANDNADYRGRNWGDFTIYGGNFEDDDAAKADYEAHIANRDFEGFKVIDQRKGVGTDVLPDKNYFEVMMDLQAPVTEKYEYFMIIVDKTCVGEGFCQMSEFRWGTLEMFQEKRNSVYEQYAALDKDIVAWQALYDSYGRELQGLNEADRPTTLLAGRSRLDSIKALISESASLYAEYVNLAGSIRQQVEDGDIQDADMTAELRTYLSEEVAPGETFPYGSYPYIIKNRQLDNSDVQSETRRLNIIVDNYGPQIDPIEVTYSVLDGTQGNDSEQFAALVDGNDDTKWCYAHNNQTAYGIFKSSEPIAPVMIRLVTGNDTGDIPSRNWKTWKIFAGNFASDGEATREAEGWVVIDDQRNVSLPSESKKAVFRNLSNPDKTLYQYFKIEIYEGWGDFFQQMGEMTFMNQGNLRQLRSTYVGQFREFMETISDADYLAEKALVREFREHFEELQLASSFAEIETLNQQLKQLQEALDECNTAYLELAERKDVLSGYTFDHADDQAFFSAYLNENLSAGEFGPDGTLPYILEQGNINAARAKQLVDYLDNVMNVVDFPDEYPNLPLSGSETWGDGFYGQLFDGKSDTKWGATFAGEEDSSWCIVKWMAPIEPFFYQLQTAWDAHYYGDRNWKDWKIYGANFKRDFDATVDAGEWVLIDEKIDVLDRRLPKENGIWAPYGFSNADAIPAGGFRYYKVVVSRSNGGAHQMSQMVFGEEADFAEIRDRYINELVGDKKPDEMTAQTELKQNYLDAVTKVEESEGIEEMFLFYYEALGEWDKVVENHNTYGRLTAAIDGIKAYLEQNPVGECDALSTLNAYLNDEVGPDAEAYPNGSYPYIIKNALLNDSTILAEIGFADTLKMMAVREGYLAGADVTSIIDDPYFEQGTKYWEGTGINKHESHGNDVLGRIPVAEGWNISRFNQYQTLTGLKNGLYVFELNGAARIKDEAKSLNHGAYIYANDNVVPLQTLREDMLLKEDAVKYENYTSDDVAIIDEESSEGDTIGYVINGINGAGVAFLSGRYQNAVVANVTDGRLTIGVCKADSAYEYVDWIVFAGTRLTYLGEVAGADAEGLNRVMDGCSGRAQTMIDYECRSDESFAKAPNFSQAERDALAQLNREKENAVTAQEKYDLAVRYSDVFKSVTTTKDAYIDYMKANLAVFDYWMNQNEYMSAELGAAFSGDIVSGQDNWLLGAFSADEAIKEAEVLRIKYPDYMAEVNNSGILACPENMVQTDAFTYDFALTDKATSVALRGMYEPLDDDQIILAFDYKTDAESLTVNAFFNTPKVSRDRSIRLEGITPSGEWRTMYYNVHFARLGEFAGAGTLMPWGHSTEHGVGFQFVGGEGKTISLRNVHVVTLKHVEDNDGTVGIGRIEVDNVGDVHARQGIYTLSGTRVGKATKGLYIIDGKKLIVK